MPSYRRPSARCYPNAVTVTPQSWSADGAGGREPTPGTPATLACNVQTESAGRMPEPLRAQAEKAITLYFPFTPAPPVTVDDLITFGARTFVLLAPLADATERGRQWVGYAKEHSP